MSSITVFPSHKLVRCAEQSEADQSRTILLPKSVRLTEQLSFWLFKIFDDFEFRTGFVPLYRAEHRRVGAELPAGAMQGGIAFYVGAGKPLRKTPFKPEERRINAAFGSPFLWILSFGEAKESTTAVGPRTDIKSISRDSDTK